MSTNNQQNINTISISSDIGMEIDPYLNQSTTTTGAPQQSKSMQKINFKLTQLRNC